MSEPRPRPISFLSDFGHGDEFVGVVHGVILRVDPRLTVIDITHAVPRGDVRAGALALLRAIQYMPPGVCLAVVDPGVGGSRAAIAAETPWGFFVGPDNGLMAPAVAMVGGATRFVALEAEEFRLPREGVTFDGRDVFAPAAAVLASGEAGIDELGPELAPEAITPLLLPLVDHREGAVDGEVWWIDHFGNAQTNVSPDDLALAGLGQGSRVAVRIAGTTHEMEWRPAYGPGGGGGIIHIDSYGMVAIAVPGGSAADTFGLREGLSVGFGVVDGATDGREGSAPSIEG
jgi:S-adenosyl-L-methionine hydrolase (adenosine-forming)